VIVKGATGIGMNRTQTQFGFRGLIIFFIMGTTFPLLADESNLDIWNGSYTPYQSEMLDVEYEFETVRQDGVERARITMKLELEPKSDFSYLLEEVVMDEARITFIIRKPLEIKHCELRVQGNGDFLGQCRSSLDNEGKHQTRIVMTPSSTK
jgi:hypothetical protein